MMYVFRADAGIDIGNGHIMRCLVLADDLKSRGARTHFICREYRGHLRDFILKRGHEVTLLPAWSDEQTQDTSAEQSVYANPVPFSEMTDADQTAELVERWHPQWLIVDHYGIRAQWHRRLRPHTEKIMVVDDLTEGSFDCDVLLNQNLGSAEADYTKRVPAECVLMTGPRYALLRPEFEQLRDEALAKRKTSRTLRKVLVSVGGSDPNNLIAAILDQLSKVTEFQRNEVTIAVGSQSPHNEDLLVRIKKLPFHELVFDAANMAELMLEADYAIGAAGASSWERCCMALPSIVFALADNQKPAATALAAAQAVKLIGHPAELGDAVDWGNNYLTCAENAARICDGGGCRRVARLLM